MLPAAVVGGGGGAPLHRLLPPIGADSQIQVVLYGAQVISWKNERRGRDYKKNEHLAASVDIVFPVIHGRFGEDGGIQELLEKSNVPFVGTRSKECRTAFHKDLIWDEKSQLLLGVRRANRQQTLFPSSVLSVDGMHIGVSAAAAHAAANRSPFTIFYNPRACPSEFVIPLTSYRKPVFGTQLSVGMRFRMMFETEESGTRSYHYLPLHPTSSVIRHSLTPSYLMMLDSFVPV
ncbi:hypothetical protein L2E82_47598 [Cichorium intybus]|uniref:Uncharacterized protein n=1 Tax=Cichorium intybus TaxID=13427 RepID=A0ACB8YXF0_CICIN|nr:hypothetical protein L2E82_47598 [Cichorium intybus]